MKKLVTLLALIVCLQTASAQTYVTIPDPNFAAWLQANVPSAMNGNQMDIMDPAVTTRTNIIAQGLGISDLTGVQYFDSLKYLACSGNQLISLPSLPNFVTSLDCGFNQLTSLPNFPNTLSSLDCHFNQLTTIPLLPSSIRSLNCSDNFLTSLPVLPNSIFDLDVRNNQLSSLPNLPNSLIFLKCTNNLLVTLPSIPGGVQEIECAYNQLITLPILPAGLLILNCYHNNISCFPVFPQIRNQQWSYPMVFFNIGLNPFTCLPNYIPAMDSVTLNYPLCIAGNTITNPNGCTFQNGITGSIFHDLNADCIKNGSETAVKNVEVSLYDGSNNFIKRAYTDYNGIYFFNDTIGNYHVKMDTINKPFKVQCFDPGIDSFVTLTSSHTLEDSVDFAVICKPGFDVGVQSVHTNGPVFTGLTHTLTVTAGDMAKWLNLNCVANVPGTLSFSVNGPVTYIGPVAGSLTPSVSGNVYSYAIADFGTINNTADFKLRFQTNTSAQTGEAICVNASVTPVSGDNNAVNNTYHYCYAVVNSYDPNIKEVYPVTVSPNYTDWLTYTIHFQNTGSANAANIRLEDALNAKLNTETFEVLSYSHDNLIDLAGNSLTVRFPNIQLPDSTSNPSGSIGFIQYRIKPKAGWVNDTIRNSAKIYFDFNAPIVTNTAKTYFMASTGIKVNETFEAGIKISPNPANEYLTIDIPAALDVTEKIKIRITDVLGREVLLTGCQSLLNISSLGKGIYFVSILQGNKPLVTKRIIKE